MTQAETLVEIWRGPFLESVHFGHAAICDATGQIVQAWGDPGAVILPRSSCKMVQALPLLESGAAERFGLSERQLALACASHSGAFIHTEAVERWLTDLGMDESALLCGPQVPGNREARTHLIRAEQEPGQRHNNCSGKHTGFLTLGCHLGAGPDYVALDHPVQMAVRDVFEDLTGMTSPGYGIDGCSAPNFATTVQGLARAMAQFAAPGADTRGQAMQRLVAAMASHPELVAGPRRACTELMRAMGGRAVVKTGAEAVYVGILPEQGLGVALKIMDGGTRAAECAIAALMIRLGVLSAEHPAALRYCNAPIRNRRGVDVGAVRPAAALLSR